VLPLNNPFPACDVVVPVPNPCGPVNTVCFGPTFLGSRSLFCSCIFTVLFGFIAFTGVGGGAGGIGGICGAFLLMLHNFLMDYIGYLPFPGAVLYARHTHDDRPISSEKHPRSDLPRNERVLPEKLYSFHYTHDDSV